MFIDLRQALRGLARTPAFTLVTVLLLALGIGANTATFSLVRAVLLRPPPFPEADRLVMLYEGIPEADLAEMAFSAPDLLDLREYQSSYSAIATFQSREVEVSGTEVPARLLAALVSAELFPTLGTEMTLGRGFRTEEEVPGHDVVILSHRLWQSRFGGREDVLGESVQIDRRPHLIIGVAPPGFTFPLPGMSPDAGIAELFLPRAFTGNEIRARGSMYNNEVVARLADGVSVESARGELPLLAERIRDNYPAALDQYSLELSLVPLRERVVGQAEQPLWLMLAAVGLVMLLVCANVANLALSRSSSRRREMTVRATLGAGRARLARLLLIEGLLLAGVASVLGLLLARASLAVSAHYVAAALPTPNRVEIDLPVLVFVLAVAGVSTVMFTLAPVAFSLGHAAPAAAGRGIVGPERHRLQAGLAVATAALAVVLLVAAGLLIRSFTALVGIDPGFGAVPGEVLSFGMTLPNDAYGEPAEVYAFTRNLAEQLAALPGADSVALATALPTFSTEQRAFYPDSERATSVPASPSVTWTHGPYFETLGVPLLAGRTFRDGDDEQGERVTIVSRAIAQRYWGVQEAVGQRLKWGFRDTDSPWMTVVGVVGDTNDGPLGSAPTPHLYVPYLQIGDGMLRYAAASGSPFGRTLFAALRTTSEPKALTPAAVHAVSEIDRSLPISRIRTLADLVAAGVAPQRLLMALVTAFAATGLVLAAVGLYGVLALMVHERRQEIGVRVALGARPGRIVQHVLRRGFAMAGLGVVSGLIVALASTRLLASQLHGIAPWDAITFATVPLVLALAALGACALPAWRASRVDPLETLRSE